MSAWSVALQKFARRDCDRGRNALLLAFVGWGLALLMINTSYAFTTDQYSIPADPKRASTDSSARYIFRGPYSNCRTSQSFDTEEQVYQHLKKCAPYVVKHGDVITSSEDYVITSSGEWHRHDCFNCPPALSDKIFYFKYTVRYFNTISGDTTFQTISNIEMQMDRQLGCPNSYGFEIGRWDSPGVVFSNLKCNPLPLPVEKGQCPAEGNPILTGQGRKRQEEIDMQPIAAGLQFSRVYDSTQNADWFAKSQPGTNWRHIYNRRLQISTFDGTTSVRRFGMFPQTENFFYEGGAWRQDADVSDQLTELRDGPGILIGWNYRISSDSTTESYDLAGKLLAIKFRNGVELTLVYSDANTPVTIAPISDLLIRVSDNFGRQISFNYDGQGRLTTMIDPAGGQYTYAYDEVSGNCGDTCNNLTSVTYPDGAKRTYWYNEGVHTAGANLPNALTGISDENGVRFATYKYDSSGRALSTEYVNGVAKYSATYSVPFAKTIVTDPLGTQRTHNFATILGVVKSTGQSQPGGSGCGPSASALTYDVNGNLASQTDFNGNKTTYTYDLSRNLETKRVEASGTSKARTISTTWHANYRLPLTVAEPLKITTFTYDASGNVLTKSEQATTDANGSLGLAAACVGVARTWNYAYNSLGQVLSATDPNGKVMTNTYGAMGNLATVTNALGQVTSFAEYDANGRVGRIVDPNGLITTLTYSPRGWLTSKSVGGEVTSYAYDGVGQLKTLTQPDGSTIHYTYDAAHRLTDIADNLGNSIHYVLDLMGNRTGEQVKDPSGTLARQTSRAYDALNRLQQITGGMQ